MCILNIDHADCTYVLIRVLVLNCFRISLFPYKIIILPIDSHMNNLKVFASEFPSLETNLCFTINAVVKRPSSSSFSEYECYSTNENCTGSFLTIKHVVHDRKIVLADFQAFGEFLSRKGNLNMCYFKCFKFFYCFLYRSKTLDF